MIPDMCDTASDFLRTRCFYTLLALTVTDDLSFMNFLPAFPERRLIKSENAFVTMCRWCLAAAKAVTTENPYFAAASTASAKALSVGAASCQAVFIFTNIEH